MKGHKKVIALLCLAALFSFCRKKGAEVVKVETVNGVELVHNPAAPLHPGRTVVFEEEISFGGDEAGEEGIVFEPSHLDVDSSGNVYIADREDTTIKVFGPDGRFLRSIGRRGDGPGEFRLIGALAFTPGGRLVVLDSQARRTTLFDPAGNLLGSWSWRDKRYWLALTREDSIILVEHIPGEKTRLFVKSLDYNGREIRNWGEFRFPEFVRLQRGNATFGTSVPFSPQSIFAGDRILGRFYHCLNDRYTVEVFDGEGRLFRKIDRPYEPPPVTEEDREEILRPYREGAENPIAPLMRQLNIPKLKTVMEWMLVDDLGNLWVMTNETKKDKEKTLTAIDIFDKEGRYDARVWLDLTPGLFAAGKMYQYKDDEAAGSRILTRYKVVWKDN